MVRNPKQSQRLLKWCIVSALGLIFNGLESLNQKLTRKDLEDYLVQHSSTHNISSKQVNQMIYDLKRRSYIDFGDGDSVVLTNKAKIKIIDKIVEGKRHDKRFRLVSFDIPESKRLNRDRFRFAIKRMGFRQIQKSLWACDKNIGDLIETVIKEYEVEDYVAYFVVEKSNIDQHIKNLIHKTIPQA